MDISTALKILKERDLIEDDGCLYSAAPCVAYNKGDCEVYLDGDFSVDELEAIVVYFKCCKGE